MADHHNQPGSDCLAKTVGAAATSAVAGGIFGSINAAWITNPQVKDQSGPMLRMTASIIRSHAAVFAAIGALYVGTECTLEAVRQERDMFNSFVAGCTAGSMFGLRSKSASVGFAGCAALGTMAAVVDLAGGQIAPASRKSTEFKRQWTGQNEPSSEHH